MFAFKLLITEKEKKKSKKRSLGEMQVKMKCEMEPSDELGKLDCKDWPLLFKVGLQIFFLELASNFLFLEDFNVFKEKYIFFIILELR